MQLNYYVLGQRIQKIRKNKRISQAVLSTMIDKSAGYISYGKALGDRRRTT